MTNENPAVPGMNNKLQKKGSSLLKSLFVVCVQSLSEQHHLVHGGKPAGLHARDIHT